VERIWPQVKQFVERIPAESNVLDVGASAGTLVKKVLQMRPDARVTALEPHQVALKDQEYPDACALFRGYLEDFVEKQDVKYDMIFSIQTLEHHEKPGQALASLRGCITNDGILIVDVPSIAPIFRIETIEEFFIDTHRSHFDMQSLRRILERSGWFIYQEVPIDENNLTLVCGPREEFKSLPARVETRKLNEIERQLSLYRRSVQSNRDRLGIIATKLHQAFENKKAAIWGCGRQLDVLVRHGGLEISNCTLIDRYMPRFQDRQRIFRPDEVDVGNFDVVLICATSAVDEIMSQFTGLDTDVLILTDLIRFSVTNQS
jgi:hypothetical protein